ncbi:MAG: hypothetical protein A2504_00565 [Bdellovibrionales bacterium RIFOXYD12_FULL_39_22]|nr:MAG: hypothetical protein A2385_03695 [Bdellovibrionales bacterium RIFOXYB1_FULL_39_21]OFZ44014.1 MAG: hypothetical protein A2485_03210 [Bdellovibrionales bacterium RIFOXYC12_FULL_39_17]OFZ48034.1 MAG: hypothetical protein A2404_01605 [Bdellovibrionales bacterium RIFOXYC1_FULL_39_130]OFZ76498.1 MAG: hypothetical protein A2560_11825 [Bdellovibrionales bacterium RIFOXYD1_FULL_39_84]OFZ76612.1 MAG: hypothetical protein A2451_07555 [Bdellovibrionales bacterium RIFOXYC2_FULL_39_8]OFZ95262.1 MAG:
MSSVIFIETLKGILKSSGITYKELGKSLKLSEAGIKKILNRADLSMERAKQICDAAGVSLLDVLRMSDESTLNVKKFSDQQAKFLIDNLSYFNFYMQLAYEQKTPQEIQREKGLSDKVLFKYLKKLDDLTLVKLMPGNKIVFPGGTVARVSTVGTSLERLKTQLTIDLITKIESSKQGVLFGGIFFLSSDEKISLEKDLKEIHEKYSRRSLSNRSIKKIKIVPR